MQFGFGVVSSFSYLRPQNVFSLKIWQKSSSPATVPTGRLHLGHFVGSLRRRVELQNSGEFDKIFIMIADAQALTDNADNPEKVRQNIIEVALDYLSVGLDPATIDALHPVAGPGTVRAGVLLHEPGDRAAFAAQPDREGQIALRGFAEGAAEGDTAQRQGIPVGFFTYPISPGVGHHGLQGHDRARGRGSGADDRADARNRPQVQRGLRRNARRTRNPAARQRRLPASAGHRRQGQDVQVAQQLHLSVGHGRRR